MVDPSLLEETYQRVLNNLHQYLPDGVLHVDLSVLQGLGLVNCENGLGSNPPSIREMFHVIESESKITLYNQKFIVWIAPQVVNRQPCTLTIIAKFVEEGPRTELAFITSGVYNTSKFVLKIVERFLAEIQENEDFLVKIGND